MKNSNNKNTQTASGSPAKAIPDAALTGVQEGAHEDYNMKGANNITVDASEVVQGHYTIVCNAVLRDPMLSWAARGLYTCIVSASTVPNFEMCFAGLVAMSRSGERATRTALNELKKEGYITQKRIINGLGQKKGTLYIIRRDPKNMLTKKQLSMPEEPEEPAERSGQLTWDDVVAEQKETEPATPKKTKKAKEVKHAYGKYENVRLTETEYATLESVHGKEALEAGIECVDSYVHKKPSKRYKNYKKVLETWGIDAGKNKLAKKKRTYTTQENPFAALLEAEQEKERIEQ